MKAELPAPLGVDEEIWPLLFDLHQEHSGWALVGAQMVILHAAVYQVARPARTRDVDLLVNLQASSTTDIAEWLKSRGFELPATSINQFGIGHRFERGDLLVDVLASDRAGPRTSRTTDPPAKTVEVPGGRGASGRLVTVRVAAGDLDGHVPTPDWIGALCLKARAAIKFVNERDKHLADLALLLGLPVELGNQLASASAKERRYVSVAASRITDSQLRVVEHAVDIRNVRAAITLFGR